MSNYALLTGPPVVEVKVEYLDGVDGDFGPDEDLAAPVSASHYNLVFGNQSQG